MNDLVFSPTTILLPKTDLQKWSVVACDQFTSEPEYWDRVEALVGKEPSTLRLITPEAYLGKVDAKEEAIRIRKTMETYLAEDIFEAYENAFVYVERTQLDGSVRRGLVGKIDLEAYDYTPGSGTPIAASEKTVVSRLPVRIEIRKNALLELPHIMVFFSDPNERVFTPITARKESLKALYDFDLCENGGRIRGWLIDGEDSLALSKLLETCAADGIELVIGDGNHSLAAAKEYWNSIKATLSPEEQKVHPARFALCEINNVYDTSIQFEPIHRVVFHTDPEGLLAFMRSELGEDGDIFITYHMAGAMGELRLPEMPFGDVISTIQTLLEKYTAEHGGTIDYVHGNGAIKMGRQPGCLALMLPKMGKSELFKTVASGKVFPKKSFSVGLGPEKRYYLECRKIVK